jgi:cytochrome c-type biogenesis protein CcmH
MLLWISFALLAAAVATLLLRAPAFLHDASQNPDFAVYRDQLTELESETAIGNIDAEQAAQARAEIARRMLKQAAHVAKPKASPKASAKSVTSIADRVLLAAAAAVPLASIALYLVVGSPSLPGRPLAERLAAPLNPAVPADMIAKVEARLREKPDDGQGWAVLAPVYLTQGRAAEAADAFARAIALVGETPERLAGLAKAHLILGNGIVNDQAHKAFSRLLVLDPNRVEAEFWLGVYEEQNGHPEVASATYAKLLAVAPSDAPWRKSVEERLNAVASKPGASPARPPAAPGVSPPVLSSATGTDPGKGPSPAEFVAAAQKLAPEMRNLMIGRMIAKATDAVISNPKDVAAWSRLVTGQKALGKSDDAEASLKRAREALTSDAPAIAELNALAKSLGLTS